MFAEDLSVSYLGGGGERVEVGNVMANYPQPYRLWEFFLITVKYQSAPYDVLTRDDIDAIWGGGVRAHEQYRFTSWTEDDRVDMGTLDSGNWRLEDPSKDQKHWQTVSNKVAVRIPSGKMILTLWDWHPLAFNPAKVRAMQGCGNLNQFNVAQFESSVLTEYAYDPGTLVFDGFKMRWRKSGLGLKKLNIELYFTDRPRGVNYHPDQSNQFLKMVNPDAPRNADGSFRNPIQLVDFDELFLPGAPAVPLPT
jgi:hypothetical protein